MKKILLILSMLAFVGASGQISQTFKNVTVNDTLKTASDSVLLIKAHLVPTSDSSLDIGTDPLRWNKLYVDTNDQNVSVFSEITITHWDTALNSWQSFRGYNNDTLIFRLDPSFTTSTYLGFGNSSWGFGALRSNTTGYHIAAFGGNTFELNTTGYQNSGFGNRVFYKNTTGYQLLGAGQGAGYENTTGVEDVYLGFHAGLNLNSSNSVFVGAQCGQGTLLGTATDNTGGGRRALVSLRHGTQNAVWGRAGFTALTDGDFNWGGGDNVGLAVTDANYLCLTGFLSGYTLTAANATTTGSFQSFYGAYTGQSIPTQLNYVGAWGYASTVGRDSTYRIGGPALRSVVIGNDSGDYTLHVFGTAAITQTPEIAVGAAGVSFLVTDATTQVQSMPFDQGVYVPVDSAGSNVTSVTPDTAFYTRVGNIVTVSGVVKIDPTTTATPTFFYMNVPVFPANWNTNRAGGTFAAYIVNESGGIIMGGPTSVVFQFNPTSTGANNFSYTYSYRIE